MNDFIQNLGFNKMIILVPSLLKLTWIGFEGNMRLAYVNGQFIHHPKASVSIEDRGYQFADGVYEVVGWFNHRPLDMERHLARLQSSLDKLDIDMPTSLAVLRAKIFQLVELNGLQEGLVYIQVTRGVAPRNHAYPDPAPRPALVITTKRGKLWDEGRFEKGIKVITTEDIRWKRCDIKTVNLIANCMAKEEARLKGAGEAWLVDDKGFVNEGSSSNAWIISHKNELITRPTKGGNILAGITRQALMDYMAETGLEFQDRPFHIDEAYQAKEAFITAASALMIPVVQINDKKIGDGKAGPLTAKLRGLYYSHLMKA